MLLDNAEPSAVFNLRQVLRAFQKVEIPCGEDFVKETVNAFFVTDRSLRPVNDSWYNGDFSNAINLLDAFGDRRQGILFPTGTWETNRGLARTFQSVADSIVGSFPRFDPHAIVGNHGPGSVSDSTSGKDKYIFPIWNQRLERVFSADIHSAVNLRLFYDEENGVADSVETQKERPAKLIPVPKNQEKPRLIASEPTANQFMQGGMRKYLLTCIKGSPLRNSVDIFDQEPSRRGALAASRDSTISTVDLKDASDRLSCWTVERVFRKRPEILSALAACRSAALHDPRYTGNTILMRKYAPQGNATVFPLQSCIYAMAAIAAVVWSSPEVRLSGIRKAGLWNAIVKASSQVRVFGDDIIVPTLALPALSSLLELCQLKVNGAKSHYSGNFAESCGMDAFRGVDVTPAYVKHIEDTESPEALASTVEVSNNFHCKGLFHTSRVIESWISPDYLRHIPISRNPDGLPIALQTFSSGTAASRTRYNSSLYREEVLCLALTALGSKVSRNKWTDLLQWFTENPSPDDSWESGVQQRVRQRLRRKWVALPR